MTKPHRISADEACIEYYGCTFEEELERNPDAPMDYEFPACCSDGCIVEPDGRCEHGHPSVLLVLGVI